MPLYEYQCDACGQRFEVIQQKFSDPAPELCTKCRKGPVRRLQSSPAIQFKGSGFYINDYAQKGKTGSDAPSSGETDTKKSSETDTKKSDSGSSDSTAKTDSATKSGSTTKSESTPASSAPKPSSD